MLSFSKILALSEPFNVVGDACYAAGKMAEGLLYLAGDDAHDSQGTAAEQRREYFVCCATILFVGSSVTSGKTSALIIRGLFTSP